MRHKSIIIILPFGVYACLFMSCYKKNKTTTEIIEKYKAYDKTWVYYVESQNIEYRFLPRNTSIYRSYLKEDGGEPILIDNTVFKNTPSGIKKIDIWHPDPKFYQINGYDGKIYIYIVIQHSEFTACSLKNIDGSENKNDRPDDEFIFFGEFNPTKKVFLLDRYVPGREGDLSDKYLKATHTNGYDFEFLYKLSEKLNC